MVRPFFLALAFAYTFATASAQQKPDRESALLLGPVKTVSSTFIEYIGSEFTNKPVIKKGDTVHYDRQGFETGRLRANDVGEIAAKEIHRYKNEGVRRLTEHFNADDKLWAREEYRYTEGQLTEKLAYNAANVLNMRTTYRYDPLGRLLEEAYRDPTILRGKTLYSYSGTSPTPTDVRFFSGDGATDIAPLGPCKGSHRIVFTYDNAQLVKTKVIYDIKNREQARFTYSYTSTGLYKKYVHKAPRQTVTHSFEYRMDSYGNWTEEIITSEWDYDYSLTSIPTVSSKKSPFEHDRIRDLKQIEKLRILKTVTTRQIDYY